MPSKSCSLDPVPTWLVKLCPALIPILCDIVNDSLSTAHVPTILKQAHVIPVLKKSNLDSNDFKNYRPISNLAFSSKLIERAVSDQLEKHCQTNNINMYFQSAYKKRHSTETALTRVQNDLLRAVDSQGGAILVLLDLSAAFDTIDHNLLLRTLQTEIGVTGKALEWFRSYLTGRQQSVKIGTKMSTPRALPFGVPQGSVLGPKLFSLYTYPLHRVIQDNGMLFHLYADDVQLYLSFNPKCSSSTDGIIQTIEACTASVSAWMRSHYLKLNNDKTEILVITRPSVNCHTITSVEIGSSIIDISANVRDLGVQYDSFLKMETHVKAICKKAYYEIHLIHKVRQYITEEAAQKLVQANVTTLLDYCNSLLVGLPKSLLALLQRVQNCAARVVKRVPKYAHITPVLKELHWLPIAQRIEYKIIMLTFKSLNGLAPAYLRDLLTSYQPGRTLRSSNDNQLSLPNHRYSTYGGRSFAIAAPMLWNALPSPMRKISSLEVFKRTLKTHLFINAFNDT